MSHSHQDSLQKKVESHLKNHPLGCTLDALDDVFDEHDRSDIEDVLVGLDERGDVLHVDETWRWL